MARDLAFSNAQVEAEWRRWRASRVEETSETLTALTVAYVAYWDAMADAWRKTTERLRGIHKAPPSELSPSSTSDPLSGIQHVDQKAALREPLVSRLDEKLETGKEAKGWMVVDLSTDSSPTKSEETEHRISVSDLSTLPLKSADAQ